MAGCESLHKRAKEILAFGALMGEVNLYVYVVIISIYRGNSALTDVSNYSDCELRLHTCILGKRFKTNTLNTLNMCLVVSKSEGLQTASWAHPFFFLNFV